MGETKGSAHIARVNRHVYSDRPCYLPKPLIKGFKDWRARTKLLPPNCWRDYRSVLQPTVKHLIPFREEIGGTERDPKSILDRLSCTRLMILIERDVS